MTDSQADSWRRWRPSPSMVVALIALFISVTGVTWAATQLPKNSVKSKQIKDGQVKSVDVADNGLTGTDINESSLNLQAGSGPAGPQGATGPQGPQGPQGPLGPLTGPAGGDLTGTYPDPTLINALRLPLGCATNEVAKPTGSGGWSCAADANSGGDITGVTPGLGLTGGGNSGAINLAVNTGAIQQRVNGTCTAGSSIRTVHADGDVTCDTATSGQNATTVFGTASVTITPGSGLTLVPGLSQSVTVPAGSKTYIATDGGLSTTGATASDFSSVNVVITIDGLALPNGGFRRVVCANTTAVPSAMTCAWSMSLASSLSAGLHPIEVYASGNNSGSNTLVSGNNSSVLQGELTVMFLKQ